MVEIRQSWKGCGREGVSVGYLAEMEELGSSVCVLVPNTRGCKVRPVYNKLARE